MPQGDRTRAVVTREVHHSHHHSHAHHHADVNQRSMPQPQAAPQQRLSRFIYSNCTGKKKAVCIGINYNNTQAQLRGCVNDAKNVRKYLIRHHNYKSHDVVMLTDDATDPRLLPTRQNILNAMHWLVHNAHPHDSLFFHCHGGQIPDTVSVRDHHMFSPPQIPPTLAGSPTSGRVSGIAQPGGAVRPSPQLEVYRRPPGRLSLKDKDGDEVDGWDEVIFPVDYKKTGVITDDEMHKLMVKPLPTGCRLTALFDSCHSGSVLDLPYLYHTNGRVKGSQVTPSHIQEKSTPADVISWSGCNDSQTSADTTEQGVAVGAMSYAFMTCLREKPNSTYQELLRNIRAILRDKYKQKPQLSSSHHIDITLRFIM
ncbi:hypothetical protein NM688_g9362 [Phlebia brevispora]|uniref:Uncharacterized protein n=1 Tax=Phlebia brevispora TaxID=194682 RepID=A0ACC1RK26_9APHY|nr:hypothetical protein NM688_g9362 [Phlebia brevispora]